MKLKEGQLLQIDENSYLRLHIPPVDDSNDFNKHDDGIIVADAHPIIWKSVRNPTKEDTEATITLLELRSLEKHETLFADKKTVKLKVWHMLADDMRKKGFNIGEGKELTIQMQQRVLLYMAQKVALQFKGR